MDNEKLFEFMTQMYSEMKEGFKEVKGEIKTTNKRLDKIEIVLENDIKLDIKALFDGYKQNTEQLTRIENEVKKHDEIILRRVK